MIIMAQEIAVDPNNIEEWFKLRSEMMNKGFDMVWSHPDWESRKQIVRFEKPKLSLRLDS